MKRIVQGAPIPLSSNNQEMKGPCKDFPLSLHSCNTEYNPTKKMRPVVTSNLTRTENSILRSTPGRGHNSNVIKSSDCSPEALIYSQGTAKTKTKPELEATEYEQQFDKKSQFMSFPVAVHNLVTQVAIEDPKIIEWIQNGEAFVVHDTGEKLGEYLMMYFKHCKYSSFQRQLNMYGFRKHTKGKFKGAFHHPNFHRDDKSSESLQSIKRRPPPMTDTRIAKRSTSIYRMASKRKVSKEDKDESHDAKKSEGYSLSTTSTFIDSDPFQVIKTEHESFYDTRTPEVHEYWAHGESVTVTKKFVTPPPTSYFGNSLSMKPQDYSTVIPWSPIRKMKKMRRCESPEPYKSKTEVCNTTRFLSPVRSGVAEENNCDTTFTIPIYSQDMDLFSRSLSPPPLLGEEERSINSCVSEAAVTHDDFCASSNCHKSDYKERPINLDHLSEFFISDDISNHWQPPTGTYKNYHSGHTHLLLPEAKSNGTFRDRCLLEEVEDTTDNDMNEVDALLMCNENLPP